jgi:hypothetical protein
MRTILGFLGNPAERRATQESKSEFEQNTNDGKSPMAKAEMHSPLLHRKLMLSNTSGVMS